MANILQFQFMVQLIKNKGMIIFVIVLMVILLAATIALVYVSKQIPIKPGDVIIKKYCYDNPFIDNTFNYETVYAVKKGNNNRWYFKSYTSDKFGHKAKYQSEFASEHEIGKRFWYDDWVIVNHVNHIDQPKVDVSQTNEPIIE